MFPFNGPRILALGFALALLPAELASSQQVASADQPRDDRTWTTEFAVDKEELTSTGRNPYFILEQGHYLVLEDGDERLVITVLAQTKVVDGVEARIVEERETKAGQLVEISRNYFAISKRTNGIFYFGEDVDIYSGGRITSHEGAWLSGANGAKFGLLIPGLPLVGGRYYQEIAPRVAMDRAEIVNVSETIQTPAGEFKNCLKTEETTPLEPDAKENKIYARGIGLVQDASLKLVRHGTNATDQK